MPPRIGSLAPRLPVWELLERLHNDAVLYPSPQNGTSRFDTLPPEIWRVINQHLTNVDVEQARRTCRAWATSLGRALVTDMYLAMCADRQQCQELCSQFCAAYPDWQHLHFWVPQKPKTADSRPEGAHFADYMAMFASLPARPHGVQAGQQEQELAGSQPHKHHPIRALTLHYLNDAVCPLPALTQLTQLAKLELVDFFPRGTSLAPLAGLPCLRHLILEYKDGTAVPHVASINELTALEVLELSLGSMFSSELTSPSCAHSRQQLCSELFSIINLPLCDKLLARLGVSHAPGGAAGAACPEGAPCPAPHNSQVLVHVAALLFHLFVGGQGILIPNLQGPAAGSVLMGALDWPLTRLNSAASALLRLVSSSSADILRGGDEERPVVGAPALATGWLEGQAGAEGERGGWSVGHGHQPGNGGRVGSGGGTRLGGGGEGEGASGDAWESRARAALQAETAQQARGALLACSSEPAAAAARAGHALSLPQALLRVLGVLWGNLRLRTLHIRNAPAEWGSSHDIFFHVLPSLVKLNVTGLDTQLDSSSSPTPSFKVEAARGTAASLNLAVHASGAHELRSAMACLCTAFSRRSSRRRGSASSGVECSSGMAAPTGKPAHRQPEQPHQPPQPPQLQPLPTTATTGRSSHACLTRQQRQPHPSSSHHPEQLVPHAITLARPASHPVSACPHSTEAQPKRASAGKQPPASTPPKLASLHLFLRNPGRGFQPLCRLREVQTSSLRDLAVDVVFEGAVSEEAAQTGGELASSQGEGEPVGEGSSKKQRATQKLMAKLGHGHVLSALLSSNLRGLRGLAIHDATDVQGPDGEDEELAAGHVWCNLCPTGLQLLSRLSLTSLRFQGLMAAPHPSSLTILTSLSQLKSLSLGSSYDSSYMPSLGLHCLPTGLTGLTLQSVNLGAAPLGHCVHLPSLSRVSLKSCGLPSLPTLAPANVIEWITFDNCFMGSVYLSDIVHLWPKLSQLEITYTHDDDWHLLHHTSDLSVLKQMTCLRKLSLITPYEAKLKVKDLVQLTQLRLLGLSPGPSASSYTQLLSLSSCRHLAGLEIKLYSDINFHMELAAAAETDGTYAAKDLHVSLQEALPMTDVLVMVDDDAVDEWVGGSGPEGSEGGSTESSESENTSDFEWSTEEEG